MRIGELAKSAGCKVVTVRYYEKMGLLAAPQRTAANYRSYSQEDAERLRFIRHCRMHGMSLEEIGQLVSLAQQSGGDNCRRVHAIVGRHLENINRQINELEKLKSSLEHMLAQCRSNGRSQCEILLGLQDMDACEYCCKCGVRKDEGDRA